MKQQNQIFIDISIFKMKEIFVHCLILILNPLKKLLSSQNKVFRDDPNYNKGMKINWESFVIVRNKIFHVEMRVFLMTCLSDLF